MITRLGLKVEGKADVDALRQAHSALKEEVYDLADTYEVLTTDLDTARKAMKGLEDEARTAKQAEDHLATSLKEVDAATQTHTTSTKTATGVLKREFDETGKSALNMGQLGLQGGRFMQDAFQGGIGGVLNNIEGVTLALGLGGGMAGALTLMGILAMAFKPQAKELAESIGLFGGAADESKGHLEGLKTKIGELEAKPFKIAVDIVQLEEAKKEVEAIEAAIAAVKAARTYQADREKESGGKVAKIVGSDAEAQAKVKAMLASELLQQDPEALAAQRDYTDAQAQWTNLANKNSKDEGLIETAGRQFEMARMVRRMNAARQRGDTALAEIQKEGGGADKAWGDLLAGAEKGRGPEQDAARQQLADLFRRAGAEGTAGEIEGADPRKLQRDAVTKGLGKTLDKFRDAAGKAIGRATDESYEADYQKELERDRQIEQSGKAAHQGGVNADRKLQQGIAAGRATAKATEEQNRRQAAQAETDQQRLATQIAQRAWELESQGMNHDMAQVAAMEQILANQAALGAQQMEVRRRLDMLLHSTREVGRTFIPRPGR
jgi:hypothetical protein